MSWTMAYVSAYIVLLLLSPPQPLHSIMLFPSIFTFFVYILLSLFCLTPASSSFSFLFLLRLFLLLLPFRPTLSLSHTPGVVWDLDAADWARALAVDAPRHSRPGGLCRRRLGKYTYERVCVCGGRLFYYMCGA